MTGSGSPLRSDRDEHLVAVGEHKVALAYDPDGEVWYVRSSSIPGLAAQAADLDELKASLPALIRYGTLP